MTLWKINPKNIKHDRYSPIINNMPDNEFSSEIQLDYTQPEPLSYTNSYKKFKSRRTYKRKKVVENIFNSLGPLKVLDIGGGDPLRTNASYLGLIKEYIEIYYCLDPSDLAWLSVSSQEKINKLKESVNPEIRFIKGIAEEVPLEDEGFDLILMMSSLDHCTNAMKVLEVCFRLLKPNGMIFIDLTNHSSIYKRLERKFFPEKAKKRRLESNKEHNFYFNPNELKRMLIKNGFFKIEKQTFQFLPEQVSFLLSKYKMGWILPYWLLKIIDVILSYLFRDSGGLMHITGKKPHFLKN